MATDDDDDDVHDDDGVHVDDGDYDDDCAHENVVAWDGGDGGVVVAVALLGACRTNIQDLSENLHGLFGKPTAYRAQTSLR